MNQAATDILGLDPQEVEALKTTPVAAAEAHPVVTTRHAPSVSPATLVQIAINQGADLDRLERLMDMHERWEKREAEKAYNAAFAEFKSAEIKVKRGKVRKEGPLKGQAYAELSDYVEAITPELSARGLSASWKLTRDEKDWIEVTCTLKHVGGHFETASMGSLPDTGPGRNVIQARASAVKYLERYTLQAVCGVADYGDDDDGNGGGSGETVKQAPLHLLAAARDAAMGGWKSLAAHVSTLTPEERALLASESPALKAAARLADTPKGAQQ